MNALLTVGYFLFNIFFNLLIYALWLRLGLRYMKFSSLHMVSQLLFTITNPLVKPVQGLFSKSNRPERIETGTFIVLIIVEIIKFTLINLLFLNQSFPISFLIIFVLADLIVQPLNLMFYMILIRVIMSWVQPNWRHPINDVICSFTNPLLRLGQSIIPVIAGFDFSAFFILLILKVVTLFISASLPIHLI